MQMRAATGFFTETVTGADIHFKSCLVFIILTPYIDKNKDFLTDVIKEAFETSSGP